MPSRRTPVPRLLGAALLAFGVIGAAGCGHEADLSISPLPAAEGRVNPGLGSEARPLSSGPGYKGSPSWAPGGERVAFLMDGYVVDRAVGGDEVTRWTTRDFFAEEAEWVGNEAITVLGGADDASEVSDGRPGSLYRTSGGGSLAVEKIASGILAVSPGPEREQLLLAIKAGPGESGIALLQDGRVERIYTGTVGGRITGLFPSPDGERVALAVRPAGSRLANELHVFDLGKGEDREVSGLDDRGILGAPQWTDRGIYFVAGSDKPAEGGDAPAYDLYRAGPEPGDPESAPGVGEDFVAGSARVSPDGGRLAVVGRLNPKSPVNLYVLELASGDFAAETTNEDMEIKTGPDDLAWSPAGTSVAIVARGASTGEPAVRAAPADELLDDFYNLYEVPVLNTVPPGVAR
jgi:Tol biopolymer transport system component